MITILSAFLALLGFWLWMRENAKLRELQVRLTLYQEQQECIPELEAALKEKEQALHALNLKQHLIQEKLNLLLKTEEQLKQTFVALSSEALEKNNRSFLDLAKLNLEQIQERGKGELDKKQQAITELLAPVKEGLVKLDLEMRQIEKERKGDQTSLQELMRSLFETEKQLRQETSNLVKALRTPLARGRWGEIQLKRVVELAGMLNYCDFYEQELDGTNRMRPDLIVRLPGGRQVIVDAKVPLQAYLEAMQTQDEATREIHLRHHSRQVRAHVTALSKKAYWESFQPTPEFVVLFLPAETFFSAALEFDPTLIEIGVEQGVILATPTTLIALLRSVAYGWKQETLSVHAAQVTELGHELYKRLIDMGSHFSKMGRSLNTAVESYNKAVGCLESRVLVTARKFKGLGAASSSLEIDSVDLVDVISRQVQAPDMQIDSEV